MAEATVLLMTALNIALTAYNVVSYRRQAARQQFEERARAEFAAYWNTTA